MIIIKFLYLYALNLLSIPEVFVKTISQRNQHLIEFQVDRKNFTLNLTLSDRKVFSSDIPVWLLKSAPKSSPNYTYELLNNVSFPINMRPKLNVTLP